MTPFVVKIGGSVLGDAEWLARFAAHAGEAARPLVVVHGGGPEISGLAERLAIPVSWVDGRRVTTPEMLDVAAMVLNGRVNKRVVAALLGAGVDAVGLSGEDGGLLAASARDGGVLGRVGELRGVRAQLLELLLAHGHTPVVSPISRGEDGSLNVNADEVAAGVGVAVGAAELLFLTDVAGVHDGRDWRACLSSSEAAELLAAGVATGGMAVKVRSALAALEAGVPLVRIGGLEMLTDLTAGTALRPAVEVAA